MITVGNEANYRGTDRLSITFGIAVEAKQFTYEEDAFDDQYDASAEYQSEMTDNTSSATDDSTSSNAGGAGIAFEGSVDEWESTPDTDLDIAF